MFHSCSLCLPGPTENWFQFWCYHLLSLCGLWVDPQNQLQGSSSLTRCHILVLYTHDLRNSMNERTHFFIKIYISHILFSKGLMFLWCVRDEWRQGQTAILTSLLLLTIARCVIFKNPLSTSSASWLELLNRGSLRTRALSLQAGSRSGLPVTNWLNCRQHLPIFFHNAHLAFASSAYLHGCISGWRLGQGSIYNIRKK